MPVIDAHTHIYPAKIAQKATEAVGDFYDYPMFAAEFAAHQEAVGERPDAWGTAEMLQSCTQDSDVSHFVVLGVATKPTQVESINNFIIGECAEHPNFVGLASMHQDYENVEAELTRIKAAGLAGIKIHPDLQKVNLDDPRLMEAYAICERLDLSVTLHTGDYRTNMSHPSRLINVLHTFPKLRVDGAHFGGWSIYGMAFEYLEKERNFMDTSSSYPFIGPRRMRELIERYGADRVMFGSDFPMGSPTLEYEQLLGVGLSKRDLEQVLWHTAENFLQREITD